MRRSSKKHTSRRRSRRSVSSSVSTASLDERITQLRQELRPEINADVHRPDSQSIRWRKPAILRASRVRRSKITSLRRHYTFCSRYRPNRSPIFLRRSLRQVLGRMKLLPHDKMILTCYDDQWRRHHSTITGGKRAIERTKKRNIVRQREEEGKESRTANDSTDSSSSSMHSSSSTETVSTMEEEHVSSGRGHTRNPQGYAPRPNHNKLHERRMYASDNEMDVDGTQDYSDASDESDSDYSMSSPNPFPSSSYRRRGNHKMESNSSVSPTTPSSGTSESASLSPITSVKSASSKPRLRLRLVNKRAHERKKRNNMSINMKDKSSVLERAIRNGRSRGTLRTMGSMYVGIRRRSRRLNVKSRDKRSF